MKILIVLSAVLAVALAKPGFLGAGLAAAPAYAAAAPAYAAAAPVLVGGVHPGLAAYGPANIVIGPGGYPLDTPEVAAARAAHLSAVGQTRARDAVINGAALAAAAAYGAYAAPAVVAAPALVAPSVAALGHGALGLNGLLAAKAAYHG